MNAKQILNIVIFVIFIVFIFGFVVTKDVHAECYPGIPCSDEITYAPLSFNNYTNSRAIIHGFVSDQGGNPINRGVIRLAEIFCNEYDECVFVLDVAYSPSAWIDSRDSSFRLKGVYPDRYVMVYGWGDVTYNYQVICEYGTRVPKVWYLNPEEKIDAGTITIYTKKIGSYDGRLIIK